MAAKKVDKAGPAMDIAELQRGTLNVCILGKTPLILNRMSEKVLHELLLPKGKKSMAERATSLKHDPYAEFLASPYKDANPQGPTHIMHLATAFKRAIAAAALDVPGSNKSQIGRLSWVNEERIAIYGIPQMLMSVVRSADMNRTPDIRTRVIVPKWCCTLSIGYVMPNLNAKSIMNLLSGAGLTQGTGDWRSGKGAGTYGSFECVVEDNADFQFLKKTAGRVPQLAAMEAPEPYDQETEDLYAFFRSEIGNRGKADLISTAPSRNGKAKRTEEAAV